jgi:PleD family two-component response regulator
MSQSVIVVVEDIFFASKIKATAEHLGIEVRFPRSMNDVLTGALASSPALLLVDLHCERCDPFALATALKADDRLRRITLVGFFSHVQTALQRRAQESGFDRVMPRSAFTKQLPEILQDTKQREA